MTAQTWAEQDNTNEHAKLHGERTRQLKKTGSRIGGPPGKKHTDHNSCSGI